MITTLTFWELLLGSVIVYWSLNRGREWFLVGVSLFYLWTLDRTSLFLLLPGSGITYWVSRGERRKSIGVALCLVAASVLTLSYFKYLPALRGAIGGREPGAFADAVVPLGASYFIFKWISYVVDGVRGGAASPTALRFLSYTAFFPTFGAGPIERFEPFAHNPHREFDIRTFGLGLNRIVYGLVKKFVFADILLSHQADRGFGFHLWSPYSLEWILRNLQAAPTLRVWQFAANRFYFTYFDFSAYSDIAIGASLLFGYRICENFNYPFLATNPREFWNRWHMSLSAWCQRYVYLPTAAKFRNPYLAIMAAMIAIGVWHSGTANLVAWGLYHGALLCAYQVWGRFRRKRRWPTQIPLLGVMGWVVTQAAVVAAVSFTATDRLGLRPAFRLLFKLFGVNFA